MGQAVFPQAIYAFRTFEQLIMMSTAMPYCPICYICKKPVSIESRTTDENGKTVHGGCYFLKITARKLKAKPSTS